jgi:hypothetical protein
MVDSLPGQADGVGYLTGARRLVVGDGFEYVTI